MATFDSDTSALIERATLNASRTEHDLEAWIFDQVHPVASARIADLGCGTGKQIFALAQHLSPDTQIVGVDISAEAVAEVNARARHEGLPNVRALRGSLDDCPGALPGGGFDLILSTYAIYYARDMSGLLKRLAGVLNPDGQIFLCGPGAGTNREMIDLVNQLEDVLDDAAPEVDDFVGEEQLDALRQLFGSVSVSRLTNTATFTSPTEVLTWWRNHNMYRSGLDDRVQERLARAFGVDSSFRLTKNVLAVHARA